MINWFEIPATDIKRAIKFYSSVLNQTVERQDMGGTPYAILPAAEGKTGGAIAQGEQYQPTSEGVTVYIEIDGDLQQTLDRVEDAGGKTLVPKTSLGEYGGYFALFLDSEGNRMGLWSAQ